MNEQKDSHQQRLPNRRKTVIRPRLPALRNATHELPSSTSILTRIHIDLALAQISRDAVPSQQERAGREPSDRDRQLVQERLVPQTPAVDGILDAADLGPARPRVRGPVDGKVDERRLGRVVLPRREEGLPVAERYRARV